MVFLSKAAVILELVFAGNLVLGAKGKETSCDSVMLTAGDTTARSLLKPTPRHQGAQAVAAALQSWLEDTSSCSGAKGGL